MNLQHLSSFLLVSISFLSIVQCRPRPSPSISINSFNSTCTSSSQCAYNQFLECIVGKCTCADIINQMYDFEMKQCTLLVGRPCINSDEDNLAPATVKCGTNSICSSNGVCQCKSGYSMTSHFTCKLDFGEPCYVTSDQCDKVKGLKCSSITSSCQCFNSSFLHQAPLGCIPSDLLLFTSRQSTFDTQNPTFTSDQLKEIQQMMTDISQLDGLLSGIEQFQKQQQMVLNTFNRPGGSQKIDNIINPEDLQSLNLNVEVTQRPPSSSLDSALVLQQAFPFLQQLSGQANQNSPSSFQVPLLRTLISGNQLQSSRTLCLDNENPLNIITMLFTPFIQGIQNVISTFTSGSTQRSMQQASQGFIQGMTNFISQFIPVIHNVLMKMTNTVTGIMGSVENSARRSIGNNNNNGANTNQFKVLSDAIAGGNLQQSVLDDYDFGNSTTDTEYDYENPGSGSNVPSNQMPAIIPLSFPVLLPRLRLLQMLFPRLRLLRTMPRIG